MSEDSDSKPYRYPGLDGQDGASACRGAASCSSMAQLHRMGGFSAARPDLDLPSEGSDSSGPDPPAGRQGARSRSLREDDAEMKSSGSSGSGNESHGNESHGNDSHGNESTASSNGNSKDSALLESSESNKSSNSHSLSPPGSSTAFSLLSGSSEQDNPSTSGCSSEESAKAKTQKELLKTLKELKQLLPAEKRNKGNKPSTLSALKYALRCVRQVEANEEYYQMLMINDSQPSGLDVSSYTIEEIDSITSEYTLKNNDMFAVAVSLVTGKIVYISDQAASILGCERAVFTDAKFVEFLTPRDVSLFYTFTTPYRLPSWGMCTAAESSPPDCTQEKSFFCRISGGKECKGDLQYYPFRMTPYLMKVQDRTHAEDQYCCLLLAERVHSGYEAPRIPTDKRIFTTTHTPSCVFQDVDERAVPLLGYLPQDLIGTQVLQHLHPKDRPIMLGIHRKILQYAGQPFDHSSIRFCTRNGEYVVVDTSWSSFVNPWSRKVSFVIGRHKVRMGPVNEDVFVSPMEVRGVGSDVQEITEQIHRLLLQTVHNNGSSGYGSLGSNDHLLGTTSSNESVANDNGSRMLTAEEEGKSSKTKPRTFQEICQGIQRQKSQEQQVCLSSSTKPDTKKSNSKYQQKGVVRPKDSAPPRSWKETGGGALEEGSRASVTEELAFHDQTVYSYQQISCLDSVIRYLESCNVPITMKRKCHSSSNTTSSNSDEDTQKGSVPMQVSEEQALLKAQPLLPPLDDADKKPTGTATAVVGTSLAPLALPSKAESVLSITSQCSYSSTIVHVGDKKPQPESEIIEDVSGAGEAGEAGQTTGTLPSAVSPPSHEREPYKKLGLTKQVLAAHTEKEEQAFLYRFRELRGVKAFKADCSHYLERRRGQIASDAVPAAHPCRHGSAGAGASARRGGRGRRTKSKRAKQNESSGSGESLEQQRRRQPSSAPLRAQVPGAYPLQSYAGAGAAPPRPDPSLHGFGDRDPRGPPSVPPPAYPAPLVTPMVALVLPNYILPQMGSGPPPQQPFYQLEAGCFPGHPQPYGPQTAYPGQGPYPPQLSFSIQAQFHPQNPFAPQMGFPTQPFAFSLSPGAPKPGGEGLSRPSTPQSVLARDQASPPLFQSRCSSPLQLNLLQLEESQRSLDSTALPGGPQGNNAGAEKGCTVSQAQEKELQKPTLNLPGPSGPFCSEDTACVFERVCWDRVFTRLRCSNKEADSHDNGNHSDANSSSCDLLDILLHEDSRSGTGSATSGSMGSGLNGCGMSASGTSNSRTSASGASASGTGSNNSSSYFGSVDSSQNSQKVKGHPSGEQGSGSSEGRPMEVEQNQHFKCVLQDPPWLLRANADEEVMMTYQLPSRDIQRVLRGDRERLKAMQSSQPCFTGDQRRELLEVHPWLRRGGLPKAINVKACVCCDDALASEEPSDLDMGETEMDTAELGPPREPGDEPSNTDIHPCPCSPRPQDS